MLLLFLFVCLTFCATEFRFRKGTGKIFSTGQFDPEYLPRGRGGHAQWGNDDTIYIFGGFTNLEMDRMTTYSLNDFWIYKIDTNEWKYAGGCDMTEKEDQQNMLGNYSEGRLYPGARYGSIAYLLEDKLYLYGGKGYSNIPDTQIVLADLWTLPIENIDESVTGNITVYWECTLCETEDEISGTFSGEMNPGAKYMSTVWKLNDKEVYIFGGSSYSSSGTYGFMNDMWKVTVDSFSYQTGGTTPFEGSEGSFTGTIQPPAMYGASGWVYSNKLYLFGGRGLKSGVTTKTPEEDDLTYFNHLFSYAPSSKKWTYLGGDQENENSLGVGEDIQSLDLGEKQVTVNENATEYNSENWPGSRAFHFTFSNGKELWMFGGIGLEAFSDGTTNGKPYSNFWQYDASQKQWKVHSNWMLPDGEGGEYETINEFSETNHIGSKHLGACYKPENSNSVYIMFGWGADTENVKYGAYYDTLMATTDEIWELNVDKVRSPSSGSIAAAILVPLFLIICCIIIVIAVVAIVAVVVIVVKKKND